MSQAPETPPTTALGAQARRGAALLVTRHAIVQVVSLAAGIVTARHVTPAQFGLYAAAAVVVGVAQLLADLGLVSRLVQRQEAPSRAELRVALTIQLATALAIAAVVAAAAGPLSARLLEPGHDAAGLVRLLLVEMVLVAWRTVQASPLERRLRYERLAPLEVVEQLVFVVGSAVLAVQGWGAWSFAAAAVLRASLGAALVSVLTPALVLPTLALRGGRELVRAGRPFQVANLVNAVGSWASTLAIAWVVGPIGLGLVNWAAGQARRPVALLGAVNRVAFPYFSRLQHDPAEVERALTRVLSAVLLGVGAWCGLILVAGDPAVRWLFTDRWAPAVPALAVYALSIGLDAIVWLSSAALHALNLVSLATRRAAIRTVATIVATVPLVLWLGYNGAPLAYVVALTVTLPLCFHGLPPGALSRVLSPAAWLLAPLLAAIGAGALVRRLDLWLPAQVMATSGTFLLAYTGVAALCAPAWLRAAVADGLRRRAVTPRAPSA